MDELRVLYEKFNGFPENSFDGVVFVVPNRKKGGNHQAAARLLSTKQVGGLMTNCLLPGGILGMLDTIASSDNPEVIQRTMNLAMKVKSPNFSLNKDRQLMLQGAGQVELVQALRIEEGTQKTTTLVVKSDWIPMGDFQQDNRPQPIQLVDCVGKIMLNLSVPVEGPIGKGQQQFTTIEELFSAIQPAWLGLPNYNEADGHIEAAKNYRLRMLVEAILKRQERTSELEKYLQLAATAVGPKSHSYKPQVPPSAVSAWDDDED